MSYIYLVVFFQGEEERYSIPYDKIPKEDENLFAICDCKQNHNPTRKQKVLETIQKYSAYKLSIRKSNTGIFSYKVPQSGNIFNTFIINY